MSDFQPAPMVPEYRIDAIEFRDHAVVVSYTEMDQYRNPFVRDHLNREILPGDPDVDAKVREIMEDVLELIDLAHVARRQPPETKPARSG